MNEEGRVINKIIDSFNNTDMDADTKLKILINVTMSFLAIHSTSAKEFDKKLKDCTDRMLKEKVNFFVEDRS